MKTDTKEIKILIDQWLIAYEKTTIERPITQYDRECNVINKGAILALTYLKEDIEKLEDLADSEDEKGSLMGIQE